MPTTFSYKNDEDQDRRASPDERRQQSARELQDAEQQRAFDRDFNDMADPNNLAKDGTSGDLSGGPAVRRGENEPGWDDRVSRPGESSYGGKKTAAGRRLTSANVIAVLRKRGPLGLIAVIGVSGGLIGTFLFSPGLLLLQMKEVMFDKFNTALTSLDTRYNKIINIKMDGTTKGFCATRVTIACRYDTMSESQIKKLARAGVVVEGSPNAFGRVKPTAFVFDGKSIPPSQFKAELRSSPTFNNAMRQAYNPRFATFTDNLTSGFADKVWSKAAGRIGVTKAVTPTGNTPEEIEENIRERVANGNSSAVIRSVDTGDTNPETGQPYTEAEAQAFNDAAARQAAEFSSELDPTIRAGAAVLDEVVEVAGLGLSLESAGSTAASTIGNSLKITGVADTACQAYGAVQTLGYAAKTIRAIQLARYAYVFMNAADRIREGTADAAYIAYLGTVLTEVVKDADDITARLKRGSATDSFGYRYAAYGTTGKMSYYASQFLAGGGLTGELINFTSTLNAALGGNPKQVCGTLANPFVQAGSIIGGIALMFVPIGGQVLTASRVAASAGLQTTFAIAMIAIPELLKDIVAGAVTEGIFGEDSGDGYTSGAGTFFANLAGFGGNAPMSKEDTLKYLPIQEEVAARYGREEAATMSPLDPTNRYTFMGSLAYSLMPYTSTSGQPLGEVLGSIGSFVAGSFGVLSPKSSAVTLAEQEAALDMCNDTEYQELGVATDPFCNVIYGIPPQYLDKDPVQVANELIDTGMVNTDTGEPQGDYSNFIRDCVERTEPLGSQGADLQYAMGDNCKINDSNANYYLYFIDQRVNNGLDGYTDDADTSGFGAEAALPLDPGYSVNTGGGFDDPGYEAAGGTGVHKGIDLAGYQGSSLGKPVYAVMGGTVIESGKGNGCNNGATGNNTVTIKHEDGTTTGYMHMHGDSILVGTGDEVTTGQRIGSINGCGEALSAHLHFEAQAGTNTDAWLGSIPKVTKFGEEWLNPTAYLAHYGVSL